MKEENQITEESMTAPTFEVNVLKLPTPSPWKCLLSGSMSNGIIFQPNLGQEPNWFNRLMQRLILGFRWYK